MRRRTGQRTSTAGLKMPDMRQSQSKQGYGLAKGSIGKRIGLAHERAGNNVIAALLDPVETRNTIDIDDDRRRHEAHIQHGAERLPARKDTRLLTMTG